LGPAQIEAMLHRSLLQVNSLARQNIALKGELAGAQSQRPDLSAAMAEWAKANGFATTDVDTKVQQWAEDIQRRAEQASVQQRALAELALKHYTAAAQLFGKAADADTAALDADDQAYVAKKRTDLTQLLKDSQQRANSLRLAPQYDDLMSPQNKVIGFVLSSTPYQEATRTLEVARDRAAAELKRFPEDQGLQAIWLHATASVANSSIEEAEVLSVDDSLPLLAQSADDYRSAVNGYHALGDRLAEGDADVGLGKALSVEGRRAGGDKAIELLDQAAQAYRSALEAYTKADLPQFGADIQRLAEGNADVELGYVLSDEGHRAGGEKAIELQDQAAQAYRSALEAYTKADFPDLWAYTQLDLGIALGEEGATASGDKAAALFDQAARAFRGALEVCTKADLPRDWAWIERDLGAALFDEGNFVAGDKAIAVFDQAVQAYQRSLEVYTKTDFPQDWARMQMLLGGAFEEEAKRATGDKAASLHTQADQAFQRAQEVK
jgi:hypothetical protein